MKNSLLAFSLLPLTGSLLLTGCIVEERHYGYGPHGRHVVVRQTAVVGLPTIGAEVIVTQPAPALRTEVVVMRPGPAYVWIPGCWCWRGSAWVWEGGRWELPPRPGAVWVPHRYVMRGGAHVYVQGGWRL
jgi:hypothetical protein